MSEVQGMKVFLLIIVLVLVLATPALAEHTAEHVQQETQRLMDAYLPPGYGDHRGVYGIDPLGEPRQLYLYTLAGMCQNYGGYYFWAGDDYYWHDCTGARH